MLTPNAILETGSRALKTFQVAIGTTSHNITNAQTDGYSRQRADLEASPSFPNMPGWIGTGVFVTGIARMRSTAYDLVVRAEIGQTGQWDQNKSAAGALETLFGSATDGDVGNAMHTFWNGLQDLTTHPEDLGVRQAVVDDAAELASSFRDANARLDTANASLNQSVTDAVTEANGYITEIALLNDAIAKAEFGGNNANDMRDRRDLLLDKLAALTDIAVTEQPNGMVDVDVNGQALVTGTAANTLSAVLNAGTGHVEVQWGGSPLGFTTGRFQGFVDSYANLDGARSNLNQIAASLISEVNAVHATGFDLQGNAGGVFFTGTNASDIAVSAGLQADPSLIAASDTAAPGGNAVALQLAQLRNKKTVPSGIPTATLNEAFAQLVVQLGSASKQAQDRSDSAALSVQAAKDRRSSISGVNMDEEVSNLLSLQRAYQASARVVTAVDEMMDRIINHTGRVGL